MRDGHMEKKDKKSKKKEKKRKENGGRARREREREIKGIFFSLLSKIYGNRTVGFHRPKRKS